MGLRVMSGVPATATWLVTWKAAEKMAMPKENGSWES